MAVKINLGSDTSTTMAGIAAKVGMEDTANQLQAAGYSISITPKSVEILSSSGQQVASKAISSDALQLFLNGHLAPMSNSVVKDKFKDLFMEAGSKLPAPPPAPVAAYEEITAVVNKKKKPATKKATPTQTLPLPPMAAVATPTVAVSTNGSERKKLSLATALGQPVYGSSSESMYHVIALGPLNVAARVHKAGGNWKISIRFEGSQIGKYQEGLSMAGINVNEGYASQHLNVSGDETIANRAVGALLFASGVPYSAILPDVSAIYGKGI